MQNDAAANQRSLEMKEKVGNMLLGICNSKLQKAALTVQVQDLIHSQGLQHPDECPLMPVFDQHSCSILTDVGEGTWSSKLAEAFWDADVAHKRVIEEFVTQLKTLLKDRVCS